MRLIRLIIEIPEELANKEHWYTDKEIWTVIRAAQNGIPIPDNATNVLDAIKLEIKQEYDNQGDWSFNDGLAFALEIIDKYARENRNENGTLDI